MTTSVLPHDADDSESTFLKDNSRKKTYAEVTQDICMPDLSCNIGNAEDTSQPSHDSATPKPPATMTYTTAIPMAWTTKLGQFEFQQS